MPPSPLQLILTTPSLRNVTIATPSDEFYYEIVTPDWDPLYTKIRRLDAESGQMSLIAELKREEGQSKYTGLRFTSADQPEKDERAYTSPAEFLSAESDAAEGKVLGSFTGENGKRYRWQEAKGSVELLSADETETKPLVRYHKHHRYLGVLRMSKNPILEVDPGLAETMNTVIVSFLIAEGKRRRGT